MQRELTINLEKGTKELQRSSRTNQKKVQLENREHYKPHEASTVNTTQTKVNQIIDKLHRGKHIDDMTKKGFLKPPARLEFLFFTRLQNPQTYSGRKTDHLKVVTAPN